MILQINLQWYFNNFCRSLWRIEIKQLLPDEEFKEIINNKLATQIHNEFFPILRRSSEIEEFWDVAVISMKSLWC